MAGIIDTIKLAGVLVLALPAAYAGLEIWFVRGEALIGGTLLVLAAGLVVGQRWLTTPSDIPGLAAKRLGSAVVRDPDAENDEES